MARRRIWKWSRLLGLTLLLLVLLVFGVATLGLRASLPQYEGQRVLPGLSAGVELSRDEHGYLSVEAASRADAARALGFAHAQERFFQMDLLRRNAAGELSALVGAKALALDKSRRLHRFRSRAEAALVALPAAHRELLQAYAEGVNAGLAALASRPPEYWLLRQSPKPWQPGDSLLVVLSMYLDLQASQGRDDLAMQALHELVGPDWYAFLTQHSADWQATLDGSQAQPLPVPDALWPEVLRRAKTAGLGPVDAGDADGSHRDRGSNNFAVAGSLSSDGGGAAIVADDMHLGLRVPGTWFKASLSWRDGAGQLRRVAGVTLPGTPAVVAGSNGRIAWGFTNSTADWADVVKLRLSADGQRYLGPKGEQPLKRHVERIELADGSSVEHEVRETEWGPVLDAPFAQYALRWVAHAPEGLNMRTLDLESADSAEQALRLARGAGMPAQNLVVGDAQGRIGWTLIAAIPKRRLDSLDLPQDWSDGRQGWVGWLSPDDPAWPTVLQPADGRLWTANARVVGGAALALIGDGGYDLGARGQQIRDGLLARQRFDEAALHEIQLDHRALFLQRWRRLLLDEVLTPDFVRQHGLAEYREAIERSADAAAPEAVGYRLLRAWRERVLERLFAPLAAQLETRQLKLQDLKLATETPGWALLKSRRADALPSGTASWPALLQQAVLDSREALLKTTPDGRIASLSWGEQNRAAIRHPLSSALPAWLAAWLDMPDTPLAGDRHMPRVQLRVHGQSQRMVVAPGREAQGILAVPGGQSGHPLSPYYRADHEAWLRADPMPFLPGPAVQTLRLDAAPTTR
ncbi:penicillin acylase family protein [Roseateles sp.]|jgi:penicillin amidase|uniref:penicillin acylase family protein n=1 Tax=Roseateles sp. TaxID=1971397 RepID=UPI0037C9E0F8